ncbi:MFS transporter [Celerinatantimonas diazotrophica]|uniref:CP family cyanate transporter-like MFS transporter n=1 Tax=Celerinatantimonas diazotrophica TaxID=412034 RepID=A0A4R1K407_9GAMM|nr:MFS transporter [Celerinatantimonas diazotrophica]TCK58845.1 CP family cyanate transporter-like MFS transporter [Celerinatantimonas diazotrophica]CAG9297477.1 2-nitroimidazole transporter [Celerinatantimonas diazotrophica]
MRFSYPLLTLLLLAANLRTPITAIGPLYSDLANILHVSSASIGLVASIPLLIFALFSPFAAKLAQRIGLKNALSWALLAIVFGLLIRISGSLSSLYIGTLVCAIGIAIANVLLPSWVKENFSHHQLGTITALYAMMMGIAGSVFTALAVPLEHWGNWQIALLSPAIIAIIALLAWLPSPTPKQPVNVTRKSLPKLWRSPLAWAVTMYMAMSSLSFYIMVNWLPAMLNASGYSHSQAGFLDSIMQLVSALVGLTMAIMFKRYSLKTLAVSHALLQIVAIGGLIFYPQWALLWCVMLGYLAGGVFIIALTFMSVCAHDSQAAAQLSAMAQTVGYLIACVGPTLAGWAHQTSGSWLSVQLGYIVIMLLLALSGYWVSRHQSEL